MSDISQTGQSATEMLRHARKWEAWKRFHDRIDADETVPLNQELVEFYQDLFSIVFERYDAEPTIDATMYEAVKGRLEEKLNARGLISTPERTLFTIAFVAAHAMHALDAPPQHEPGLNAQEDSTLKWRDRKGHFMRHPRPQDGWVEELKEAANTLWTTRVDTSELAVKVELRVAGASQYQLHQVLPNQLIDVNTKRFIDIKDALTYTHGQLCKAHKDIPKSKHYDPSNGQQLLAGRLLRNEPKRAGDIMGVLLLDYVRSIAPEIAKDAVHHLDHSVRVLAEGETMYTVAAPQVERLMEGLNARVLNIAAPHLNEQQQDRLKHDLGVVQHLITMEVENYCMNHKNDFAAQAR